MLRKVTNLPRNLKKIKNLNFISKKNIVNPRVLIDQSEKKFHKKLDLYHLIGERHGNIAVLRLNQNYKNNLLSITMIKELQRFLKSYELDPTIRAIKLDCDQGKTISKGIDYSYLKYNQENQQHDKNVEYLRQLQELAYQVSKLNKPFVINLNGSLHNAAAALFTNVPYVLPSQKSVLQFNDIDFGMTPTMGTTYQLSRLPYQLGTYLALTGEPLKGIEVYKSGFGKKFLAHEKNLVQNLLEAQQEYDDTFTSEDLYGDQFQVDKQKFDQSKQDFQETLQQEIQDRILSVEGENKVHDNQRLQMAEILYKKQLAENANKNQKEMSRLGYQNQELINHLKEYESQVLDKLNLLNFDIVDEKILKDINNNKLNLKKINMIFSSNSLPEIIENLKLEQNKNDEFCQQILQKLQGKNKVALQLTLDLLRKAEKLTWLECLQQEFTVASQRIQDQDFVSSVNNFYDSYKTKENHKNINLNDEFQQNDLQKYFELESSVEMFGSQYQKDGLYPVKDFYERYPDTVRYYLNQESLNDLNLQEGQLFDVKSFLYSKNIDILRNWNFDTSVLRSQIFSQEFMKQQLSQQVGKIRSLAVDNNSISYYNDKRSSYINQYIQEQNYGSIKFKVDQITEEIFEKYFESRMENFKSIGSKAYIEQKQEYLLRIRKNLMNSRLITDPQRQYEDLVNSMNSNTVMDVQFPEKNSESIFDAQKQQVQKSHLYPLIQEIEAQTPQDQQLLNNFNINQDKMQNLLKNLEQNTTYSEYIYQVEGEQNHSQARNFDRRISEFNKRFGDVFGEDKNIYLDNLVSHYGERNQKINEFLKKYSTEQIRDIIKQNSTQQNYRIFGENLLNHLSEAQQNQQKQLSDAKKSNEYLTAKKVQNELQNNVETYTKLFDFNIENNQQQQQTELDGLQKFLQNDRELNSVLKMFQVNDKSDKQSLQVLKKRFSNVLNEIYKAKFEQICQEEARQGLNSVQLTADGKTVFKNFNQKQGGQLYMKIVDDYIEGNLQQDFHNFISSHIFFTFAALGLQELQELFKVFFNISRKFHLSQNEEENVSKVKNISQMLERSLGIKIQNAHEIQEIITFLSDATENLCLLYFMFKDKLIFPEDKLLSISQSAKFIKERDYDDLSFANYVLTAYQEQQNNLKQIEQENSNAVEMQQLDNQELQKYLQKELKITEGNQQRNLVQRIQGQINKLNSFQKERTLIPSAVLYIEKLDLLTQQVIHGKDHFLPEEQKQMIQDLPEILRDIDPYQTGEEWLQNKLQKYIESLFEIRYNFEKTASRHQLTLFDIQLSKYLEPEYLKKQLSLELEEEVQNLKVLGEVFEAQRLQEQGQNEMVEYYKRESKRRQGLVKNYDAQQKLMAFEIMMLNDPNNIERNFYGKNTEPKQKIKGDKKKNDRILHEQIKLKTKMQLDSLQGKWAIVDRLKQEQIEEQPTQNTTSQDLYKDVLGLYDFSNKQQEQESLDKKEQEKYQYSRQEILIPIQHMAEDQGLNIEKQLQSEINDFISSMKQ